MCFSSRAAADVPAEAAASIGAAARLYDLTVAPQPETQLQTFDNTIPTEILFQASGLVLFIQHLRGQAHRHCWDGSRLAAGALRDAKPFLAQADALVAISINAADASPARCCGR
jgi:hypothetical protein